MNSGYEVAFREIDDILRSPAPPLERLNSALRRLAKYRSALIQQALIAAEGTQVLNGPFSGMTLSTNSIEGCYIPKLLGCYEAELHPHIHAAVARDYRNIINVGTAEGYYAIGMARLLPNCVVYTYDIDPKAQAMCRELARRNNVAERVIVGGEFRGEDFEAFGDRKTLVICDIEGGEVTLLDPGRFPALRYMDVIAELHDLPQHKCSVIIPDRFARTHDVKLVNRSAREIELPRALEQLGDLDRLLAMWEWRAGPTPWAVMMVDAEHHQNDGTPQDARTSIDVAASRQRDAMDSPPGAFRGLDLGLTKVRPCRHGLMAYLAADQVIGRALHLYGEFAESQNIVLARLANPGDVVVDVGANIGAVSLALARRVGTGGRVYALEPQPIIFELLCANAVLNSLTNIDARRAAVGEVSGSIRVPVLDPTAAANFGEVRLADGPVGEDVPVVAIDELGLARCALIKIDVEGMEGDVLRGAERTIATHRPIVYFEAEVTSTDKTPFCIAWLFERRYRLYWHFVPFFRSENFRNLETNVFGDHGDINVLAVPQESNIQLRLPLVESPHADWKIDYRNWLSHLKAVPRDDQLVAEV